MTPADTSSVVEDSPLATGEIFADLLEESLGPDGGFEGRVVKGLVIGVDGDAVIIDVGLKSEGRVPLKEFATPGEKPTIKKINTAKELGIKVISQQEWMKMLNKTS